MKKNLLSVLLACAIIPFAAFAQPVNTDRPVVYSKTMVALVPGDTIPKTISQAPEIRGEVSDASKDEGSTEENAQKAALNPEKKALQKHIINVQVRPGQIDPDSGILNNYLLDEKNGVLTYFSQAQPRRLLAENIQKPLDILFINDEGMILQIVPQVIPAYLPDDIGTDFPLRAMLYLQAGLAESWNIKPGYRVEHGMFNPKPMIYMAPGAESKATVQ